MSAYRERVKLAQPYGTIQIETVVNELLHLEINFFAIGHIGSADQKKRLKIRGQKRREGRFGIQITQKAFDPANKITGPVVISIALP